MSVKSLLQIILILLIFFILGTIYFFYLYSKPSSEIISIENQNLSLTNNSSEDLTTEDALEEVKIKNLGTNKIDQKNKLIVNNANNEINQKNTNSSNSNNHIDEIKNLTKEIEYITSNKNGEIFKISAKYGKTNLKNNNILDLEKVNGVILSDRKSEIYISSDNAKYNYDNQDSKFYGNVEIKYDNKVITCNNLDLIISDNVAVAYSNVIMKDDKSKMKAQMITLNTITKDIIINSGDKIKIRIN